MKNDRDDRERTPLERGDKARPARRQAQVEAAAATRGRPRAPSGRGKSGR